MEKFIQLKKSPVLKRPIEAPHIQPRVQVLQEFDDTNSLISRLLSGSEDTRREKIPSRRFQLLGKS